VQTPDPQINRYINRWGKKELVWMARLWRNGISTPWRNELQDAMGYSLVDPDAARHRNAYGLVRMWDGDWTDPMNGPGRKGEGGSAWSNFALAYGCKLLEPLARQLGKTDLADRCLAYHQELGRAVREHLWCGKWFAYGLDDDGKRFGDDLDDRIWLNPQSWALISGLATKEEVTLLRQTVEERLMTPYGPLLFDPPYHDWDPVVGRVSLKVPGSTENASIYCHSAAFWAAGLAAVGDREGALNVIKRILPDDPNHPPERSGQVPIWQHNAWFGDRSSHQFGTTSGTLGTGHSALGLPHPAEKSLEPSRLRANPGYVRGRKLRANGERLK
jgi:cellobiose phosphorylase